MDRIRVRVRVRLGDRVNLKPVAAPTPLTLVRAGSNLGLPLAPAPTPASALPRTSPQASRPDPRYDLRDDQRGKET